MKFGALELTKWDAIDCKEKLGGVLLWNNFAANGSSLTRSFCGRGIRDLQVGDSRSYQGSVVPPLHGEKALKTLVLLYFGTLREGERIHEWSLLTSRTLICWVFCRFMIFWRCRSWTVKPCSCFLLGVKFPGSFWPGIVRKSPYIGCQFEGRVSEDLHTGAGKLADNRTLTDVNRRHSRICGRFSGINRR